MYLLKKKCTASFLLVFFIPFTVSYRILALFPFNGKSHFAMFENLLVNLANKGHYVDVLGHFPLNQPIPRYRDISVKGSIPHLSHLNLEHFRNLNYFQVLELMMEDCGINACNAVLNTTQVKELKATTAKYDLIIAEIFGTDCMLGFAHHLQVPVVTLTTSVNLPWANDWFGNPDNPSYIPNYFVAYTARMTLWERFINTITLIYAKYRYDALSIEAANKMNRDFFGPDTPDVRDLGRNISLHLVNSHFSINTVRPFVPNLIEVGGLHIKEVSPLSEKFAKIMETTDKYRGVIYLSFGSILQTDTLPTETLQVLMDGFRDLPYKILWKANKTKLSHEISVPGNIYLESWIPQLDILCHPNTQLFISHGGLMGSQEAIFCGVPRVGVPIFADQFLNIRDAESLGTTIEVPYEEIPNGAIAKAVRKILDNPSYKEKSEKFSKLFKDRPLSAMETAIYWIEYTIRYNGAPHLRSVGADLHWFQYYLLDIAAIIVISSLLAIYIFSYLVKTLLITSKKKVKKH